MRSRSPKSQLGRITVKRKAFALGHPPEQPLAFDLAARVIVENPDVFAQGAVSSIGAFRSAGWPYALVELI